MKRKIVPKKRCPYCGKYYTPYIRAAKTQKSCKNISCQKKHKRKLQKKWKKDNPDGFCGRYVKVKAWLKKHPGYLAKYRAEHSEYVNKDNRGRRLRRLKSKAQNADIQDTLFIGKIGQIRNIKTADMQNTLTLKLDGLLDIMFNRNAPIYKTHGQFRC
ncbi:MAG: hypothetical protein L6420_11860 [Elusimicrobia bacterium]|nr:hypothetical protein [Elusimicrobiota bacterium]